MSQIIVRFPDFPDVPELSTEHFGDGAWLVDLANWWDGVEARGENDPRPDADGDFDDDEVFGDARYPIVTGRVRYATEAERFAARKPFARMMAHRGPHILEVESPDGVWRATVVRNGKLAWDLWYGVESIEFEMPFKAADPRKYGEFQSSTTGPPSSGGGVESPVTSPFTQSSTVVGDVFGDMIGDVFPGTVSGGSSGRITLTNEGTTDTIPTFIVTGGGMTVGVELTRIETAEKLRLEWPILPTDRVVFNPGDGQVWLNDQAPIAGYLTKADWWVLGPGETATVQFEPLGVVTGSPTLSAEWRDADA